MEEKQEGNRKTKKIDRKIESKTERRKRQER